jgi:hypothetical protein
MLLADCGGPYDLTAEHTISCYEDQPTSGAELAIMAFLTSEPWRYAGRRLLHVGVGNCSFPLAFCPTVAEYVGITISLPEIVSFERKLANIKNARAFLLSKYDPRSYSLLEGEFDVVVDTLLMSVACCEKHFQQMMTFFAAKLKTGGMLITTQTGVEWGWKGNTKRAYVPGAQLDPAIGQYRILTRDGLRSIGERLGLGFAAVRVAGSPDNPADDDVLILTKHGAAPAQN